MKKISTLMLLGLAFGSIQAAQISQSQALGVASKYVAVSGPQKLVRAVDKSYGGSNAPYYIFNSADGKGFVIVAGDDQLTELVGYSKTGSIDTSNMPVQLQAFLDGYADYVARVQSGEAAANHQTLTDGAAPVVEPLVKAHWDQSEPYNNLCPVDITTKKRSVVGCVATAMAQVCDYWKWPLKPQAFSTSYRCTNGTRVQVDFSKSEYDWDKMLDSYVSTLAYTDEQANAVAKLCFDLGAAVNMDYASSASGAQDADIPYALSRFGYNCQIHYRAQYDKAAFVEVVKKELDASHPLLFSGQGSAGGHCFVADGYDTNNFFHINWGWGGVSDGYFDVDAMNPSALGTGGGSGGFNTMQSVVSVVKDETMTGDSGHMPLMIYNMFGYDGQVKPVQSSLKKGEQLDVNVKCIANMSTVHDFNGGISVAIYDEDFNCVAFSTIKNAEIPAGNMISSNLMYSFDEQLNNLPDGKYTIWAVSREADRLNDWIRMYYDDATIMNVKGNDITFGESVDLALAAPITADKNPINPGDKVKFSVSISNKTKVNVKGNLLCELRDVEAGTVLTTTKPAVSLGDKDKVDLIVTMTMMKASVKQGRKYSFNVVSFNNGSTDFAIADAQPFEFVAGEAGVGNVETSAAVSVYPNPTEGFVNVNAADEVISVEAYAADGRLAARSEGESGIDLSQCAPGIYMLKVATAAGTTVSRVVKK
ncbi:MAG: T9SS C-terminal target domain-containing protein [Bacteroidales bacterium]|nr:T9SS C-terminal target domain-containing protein [Bacteroidales bacterium]